MNGQRNHVEQPVQKLHWKHRHHPPGTKLVRRFIRQATGEAIEYRKQYLRLTGRPSV